MLAQVDWTMAEKFGVSFVFAIAMLLGIAWVARMVIHKLFRDGGVVDQCVSAWAALCVRMTAFMDSSEQLHRACQENQRTHNEHAARMCAEFRQVSADVWRLKTAAIQAVGVLESALGQLRRAGVAIDVDVDLDRVRAALEVTEAMPTAHMPGG